VRAIIFTMQQKETKRNEKKQIETIFKEEKNT